MLESKKAPTRSASLLSMFLLTILSSPLLGQTPTFKQVATGDIAANTGNSLSASWGDFNSDGKLDLFIANTGFDANFLYSGTGDSVFNRVTSGDIVNDFNPAQGGAWGDFNNDGHLDIFVPFEIPNNRLYSNKGNGSFTAITIGDIVNDGGRSLSAAWGDYNNDGFLDLAVANDQGQNDFLYKNNGDGTFTKITAGPVVSDGADGACVAWGDYDNDGDLDLFVGNQNGQNNALYQNNGDGSFSAVTSGPVVSDGANTQGASWGDYDNDRDLDLFVANSGGANALYRNEGSGNFTAITTGPVVTDINDAHGSAWGDFDNDGDLDLFVSTHSDVAANLFYENNGDGSFSSISGAPTLALGFATGTSWADIEGDGDLDLFVAQDQSATNLLFVNEGASGNWLDIELTGILANKRAVGATVLVYAEIDGKQVAQMREISSQTGRGGQNGLAARFGLGDAANVDSIRIKWPSGVSQWLRNVAPNQFLAVEEAVSLENLTFTTTEDSYIKIGDKDANFGSNPSAKVARDKFITYLKFQVDGVIDDVLNAKVQLQVADNSDDGGTIFLAENTFKGTNDAWQEETLTSLNAPNFLGLPLSALADVSLNDIVEFNVTQAIGGNGLFTFAIESNSLDDVKYFMKEGQTPPKLILQVIANEVNTPPVAEDDIASVQVNTPTDIPVTNNDSGIDDPLDLPTLTILSNVSNGTTNIDSPGIVTYTPNAGYLGPDSFTYTIRDEAGDISNLATVLITVRPPNVAPTANDDQAETTDQLTVSIPVLANDSDDSQLLPETVTIVSPPSRGAATVNLATGAITYTPTPGALGTDSFTYTVDDNNGATSNEATVSVIVTKGPQLVTLTFNPSDDAQVRSAAPRENFGSRTTMKVLGSEFITYLKFNVAGLTGNIQTMKLRLRVTDGSANSSASGGRIFHVSNDFIDTDTPWTEDRLTFKNAPVTSRTHFAALGPVTENTWVEIDVRSIVVEDGVYSFMVRTLIPDLAKYYSKEGLFPPELVVTTLALVGNDPPVARNDEIKLRVNTPATFNPLDNDEDANGQLEPSTLNLTSQPGHGTVSVDGVSGEITYTPDTDFQGSDSFFYTVEDNESARSNQATVTLNVFPPNVAPVATADFATTFQNNAVDIDVLANDTDADGFLDPTTVAIQTQPKRGTASVNSQTGVLTYSPPTGFVGRDTLFYSASDDDGELSNVARVEIVTNKTPDIRVASFRPTDDAQVKSTEPNENYGSRATTKIQVDRFSAFLKFNISNLEGNVSSAKLRIQVTDFPGDDGPNGGSIYAVANTFDGESIDWDESQLTFANSPNVSGEPLSTAGEVELNQIVEFDVTSAITGNGIFSFAILGNVSDVVKYFMKESLFSPSLLVETLVLVENQNPVAFDDAVDARLNEIKIIDVTTNDSDPDGAIDPTSVQVVSQPAHGNVAPGGASNLLTYTPNTDFIGIDQFTYRVRDFEGGVSNTATVTITIHPPNLRPEANDDVAATLSVFAVDIDVLANDVDNDGTILPNSVTIGIQPSNGAVQINLTNGIITYTPGNGFVGLETFTYTVSDDDGLVSEPATVTITVSQAPELVTRTFGAREDGYVKVNSAARFGTRSTAKVEKGRYRAYFKFDASDLTGQIKTATLLLTVTDGPEDGSSDGGSVFLVSNTFDGSSVPWNEDEINDPNSPAIDGAPLASEGAVVPNQVVEFDVSSAMREPGIYSFAITSNSSNQVKYFAHEGIAPPRLVVEAFTEPENTPPFAVADDTTTGREQEILIDVLKNDKDLDGSINPNTVHVVSPPAHGATLVAAGGFIRYTPNSGFLGTDSFTYTVEDDENAASGPATVKVRVVDNSNWSNLDSGLDFVVLALAAGNNEVYAAGTHAVNGTHHLFAWDAGQWSEVTSNINGKINAMEISNGVLYVVGNFTSIAGISANRIARRNGGAWEALGAGLDGEVQSLAIDGDDLYIGGDFLNAGGNPASRAAHWNGAAWSALGDGFDNTAFAMALNGSQLFAGGDFQNSGSTQTNYVARWDGANWIPLASGVNGRVRDLTRNGSGIYVAGDFTIAGLANAKGVAQWDGANWTGLAGGVNDNVRTIVSAGAVLFAAGDFRKADGKLAPYSAKWDGKDWTPLGTGLDAPGRAVAADGNNIFFGGSFDVAGGLQANHIAQWTEVNQPPIAVSDTFDTEINSAIEFNVLANDIDPNGNINPSSLNILLQPLNGQIAVDNATGRIIYTPVQNFVGKDIFEYQISDSDGETSNTAAVTVRVNPANVAPIAVNDATSTPQDSPVELDIVANDTDVDGSVIPATVQVTNQTANGAVALNPTTGVVTYTPDSGFIGIDKFMYTVQDDEGATSNEATASIVVSRLQNASLDFRSIEDGMVKRNSTRRFGTRTNAKLAKDKFSIFFKFNVDGIAGEISRATLKLTVTDSEGDGSDDGGTLFQTSNDFDGGNTAWNEDELNDPNSPGRTSLPLASAGAIVANQVVEFDVSSVVNQPGIYSFSLTSNSPDQAKYFTHESSHDPVLTVETLIAVENNPPAAGDDLANGRLNQPLTIDVTANDSDPEGALNKNSVTVAAQPAHGTLQTGNSAGTFIYTPESGFLGADAFSYTIEDQDGITSNLATVTIRIFPENTPPVAVNDGAATATGFPVTIAVLANDSDNDGNIDPTTLTLESQPASGSAQVNQNNGIVTYAANSGFIGRDSFSYSVKDNDGATSNIATVTVAVTDAPSVASERFSPTDDAQVKVANSPRNFGGKRTGKVEKDKFSIYLKFNVTGLSGQVKSARVKMKVADFAEDESDDGGSIFPVSNLFKNSDASWDEGGILFQNAPEVSGSPLDSAGKIKKKQEVFFDVTSTVVGDGIFSFAIVNDSRDQGKYWMKEGDFPPELIVETFAFGANAKPVAIDDNASTRPNQPVTINVTDNDLDPDGILDNSTVAVQTQPANGALSAGGSANILTYTPGSGFEGADTFTYTVKDDKGEVSNVATVTIAVNNNNRPPVAVNDVATTAIGLPVEIAILTNDSDSDGSVIPASVTITAPPTNGSAVKSTQSGAVTYTPNGGFIGADAFTYTVEDNEGAVSNEATVTITVSNATTRTVRFQPVHDGQVKNTSPDRNYGSKSTTKIELGKFSSYFKFDVSGLKDGIQSARFQITVTSAAGDASKDGGTLFPASNDFSDNPAPWTQDLLTFSNAPRTTGAALANAGPISVTQTVGFDVTSAITGDGIYSFCLTSNSGDQAKYFTREGANPPELVIATLSTGGNIAPVAVDDQATTTSGQAVVVDILRNDSDLDGSLVRASVSIRTPPNHGTAAVNPSSGLVTFTPAAGFSGSDSFTYTVEDNAGVTSNEATAAITINSPGGVRSFTFTPAHDGQVKLTGPGLNFGGKPTGKVEQGKYDTYLKFNVSGLTGAVTKATLRMKVAPAASDGSDSGGSVYSVSNSHHGGGQTWTEQALTAANAPQIRGGALSTAGPVTANARVDLDVTPAITGNGVFSFALNSTSRNRAKYYLKEGAFPPELIVEVVSSTGNQPPTAADDQITTISNLAAVLDVMENDSDADGEIVRRSLTIQNQPENGAVRVNPHSMLITYTPASGFSGEDSFTYTVDDNDGATSNVATVTITVRGSAGSQLLTFEPVADAAVKAATPTTNYGTANRLLVETQTEGDAAKKQTTIYLQFEVADVTGPVQSATVRLHKTSRDLVTASIYRVSNFFKDSDSRWQEEMLVWDNAPTLVGKPINTTETAKQEVEFDVSGAISENGAYSFAIRLDSRDASTFDSKEGANGPQLIVVTGDEAEAVSEEMDAAADEQEIADVLPTEFSLSQNYPNPFNAGTTIRYALPENARVKLRIYNVRGQLVRTLVDGEQEAGFKTLSWLGANDNGRDVASGIYFMQLEVQQKKFVQRMLFQK